MALNLRDGINPITDFKLPERIMPPVLKGPGWPETNLNTMVKEYLKAMDWDEVTCIPSRDRLKQLGLEDVAKVLGV